MTAPDRLSLIESRWREAGYALNEAGSGDGEMAWLIEEVKRLRRSLPPVIATYVSGNVGIYDAKTLLARAERERRHALWVERRCWRMIPLLKRLEQERDAVERLGARIEAAEEERNTAEAEVKRLRSALGSALEPLMALELSVRWELADVVREALHGVIKTGRRALRLDA